MPLTGKTLAPTPPILAPGGGGGWGQQKREAWFTLALICIGVGCLFGSQNIMSPNLTSIAEEFGFDRDSRDRLLGARLSLAYSVYSMPGAVLLGLMADCFPRKKLFVFVVGLGSACVLASGYAETYHGLFVLRVMCGMCTNAVIPIAFSFVGDLYSPDDRSLPSTLVTAAMGIGILIGQVVAGLLGPRMGWRAAFLLVALPGVLSALLTLTYITEPMRGQSEKAIAELIRSGQEYKQKLELKAFVAMLKIRTNIILILQALPGTIPWGVLFAYLNDFLSQEKGLPVEQATLLMSLFGIGSAVGGIGGGLIGQVAYKKSKPLLPVVMAVSTAVSTLPMFVLINADYSSAATVLLVVVPSTFVAGVLANINGTNVRPLLLNVNLPETRGAVVSVANLMANLGKGIGPTIANAVMATHHGSRQFAFNVVLCLWFVCGAMVLLLVFTLLPDEAHVQEELRKKTSSMAAAGRAGSKSKGPHHHHHHLSGDEEATGGLLMTSQIHHDPTVVVSSAAPPSSSDTDALLHFRSSSSSHPLSPTKAATDPQASPKPHLHHRQQQAAGGDVA